MGSELADLLHRWTCPASLPCLRFPNQMFSNHRQFGTGTAVGTSPRTSRMASRDLVTGNRSANDFIRGGLEVRTRCIWVDDCVLGSSVTTRRPSKAYFDHVPAVWRRGLWAMVRCASCVVETKISMVGDRRSDIGYGNQREEAEPTARARRFLRYRT